MNQLVSGRLEPAGSSQPLQSNHHTYRLGGNPGTPGADGGSSPVLLKACGLAAAIPVRREPAAVAV